MIGNSNIKEEVTWSLKDAQIKRLDRFLARIGSELPQTHDNLHNVATLITAIQIKN